MRDENMERKLKAYSELNQHVNYLLCGYIGALAGIAVTLTMTVWGHPIRGIAYFWAAVFLSLLLAAFAQDRWNRKVKP